MKITKRYIHWEDFLEWLFRRKEIRGGSFEEKQQNHPGLSAGTVRPGRSSDYHL